MESYPQFVDNYVYNYILIFRETNSKEGGWKVMHIFKLLKQRLLQAKEENNEGYPQVIHNLWINVNCEIIILWKCG